jgi:hypothetical protein
MPLFVGEITVTVLVVAAVAVSVATAVTALVISIIRAFRRSNQQIGRPGRIPNDLDIKLEKGGDWNPPPECLRLEPFREGMYRKAYNVLRGKVNDLPVMVFDYQHTINPDPPTPPKVLQYRVALFQLPVDSPQLAVRPERLWDKATEWLEKKDILFESEEFNRRYHVESDDRRFAFDVLTPRAMLTLLDSKIGMSLEMNGAFLILSDGPLAEGAATSADADLELLAVGRDIVWSLPAYIRGDRPPEHPVIW